MADNSLPKSSSSKRRGRPPKHREAHEKLEEMEGLLNVPEVAIFLDVHKGLIYQLVKTQGLPATRIGKHLRFYRHDLLKWIDSRRVNETS